MKNLFFALAILSLPFFGCNFLKKETIATLTPSPTPSSITSVGKILDNSKSSETSFQLYRFLATNPSNVNFSPLSLKMAFALIYPGAVGDTQKLLEQIFGFTRNNLNPFHAEYELATKIASQKSETNQLLIQNSAWMKNAKGVKESFRQSLKAQGAEIEKIDLNAINEWVDQSTHHQIPKLLSTLDPSSRAIFINAIYFKQKWFSPFLAKDTANDHFQASPYLTVNAPTLHAQKELSYYEDEKAKWLALPYADSPFEMLFALPMKRFDLKSVNEKLSSAYLTEVTEKMKSAKVQIALPKFKFNQMGSFKNLLKNAGYDELFSDGDYSGISGTGFELSDVIQADSIEVNEEGTEASAATAVIMMNSTRIKESLFTKSFIADQPFVFILRNKDTKEIYWIGKVEQPLEAK